MKIATTLIAPVLIIVFIFVRNGVAAEAKSIVDYPIIPPGNPPYIIIPASDANLTITNLYIPAGLQILLDPTITAINWQVTNIKIDPGMATLDISAPRGAADTGATGPGSGQADYCNPGAQGKRGGAGQPGRNSVPLSITGVEHIDNEGSLWIKFDGQPGGNGGTGGQGQTGGGNRASFPHCGFARGGGGGDGGPGGPGGDVALVSITMKAAPDVNILKPYVDRSHCYPAYDLTRPSGATATSGVIAVSGEPGCQGGPGGKGPSGAEGAPRGR